MRNCDGALAALDVVDVVVAAEAAGDVVDGVVVAAS